MKTTSRRIFAAVVALALGLGVASTAQASPIVNQVTYSTSATIETQGVTGTPVVSFQGVTNGTLTTGQPFDLGKFVVENLPAGATTTCNSTPFELTFKVLSVNGTPVSPNEASVKIDGWLVGNGSLVGSVSSGLMTNLRVQMFPGTDAMALNPWQLPLPSDVKPFATGSLTNYLEVLSAGAGPWEGIRAELNQTSSVPEPSTLAFFISIAGALSLRRLWSRRKRQAR